MWQALLSTKHCFFFPPNMRGKYSFLFFIYLPYKTSMLPDPQTSPPQDVLKIKPKLLHPGVHTLVLSEARQ